MSKILKYALRFADAGYNVFFVDGKKPVRKKGPQAAEENSHDSHTDADIITKIFNEEESRVTGYGIECGRVSDLFVIDLDPRNGSDESFMSLIEDNPGLMEACMATFSVDTGGGGKHYYFKYTGKPNKKYKGIDFQTDGKYIVGPGSIHPDTQKEYCVASGTLDDVQRFMFNTQVFNKGGSEKLEANGEIGSRNNTVFDAGRKAGIKSAVDVALLVNSGFEAPLDDEEAWLAGLQGAKIGFDSVGELKIDKPIEDSSKFVKKELLNFESMNNTKIDAIPSGFHKLDMMTDGAFHKGLVSCILAPPGFGKSSLVFNLIHRFLKRDLKIGCIILEHSVTELINNLVCLEVGVKYRNYVNNTAFIDQETYNKVAEDIVDKTCIFQSYNAYDVNTVLDAIKAMIDAECDVIIWDNLNHSLDCTIDQDSFGLQGRTLSTLHTLVKRSKSAFILVSQMSKESIRADEEGWFKVAMHSVKGSASIIANIKLLVGIEYNQKTHERRLKVLKVNATGQMGVADTIMMSEKGRLWSFNPDEPPDSFF